MNHLAQPFRRGLAELAAGRTEAALPWLQASLDDPHDGALAQLNLGMALADLGRLSEAERHLQAAARQCPSIAEPRFRLAQIAAQRLNAVAARQGYEGALAIDPCHVMSLAGLGSLHEAAGETEAAIRLVRHALLLAPDDAGLLAMQARLTGDVLAPLHAGAADLDTLRAAAGAPLPLLEAGCAAAPLDWRWRAALALAQPDTEAAIAALRLACILSGDAPLLLGLMGQKLMAQRRHTEAAPLLAVAITAQPADAGLRSQYGIALLRLHRLAEAKTALEAAVDDFGPLPALLSNLALALVGQGRQEEALCAARRTGGNVLALGALLGIQPYHPREGSAAALHATARLLGAQLRVSTRLHPPGFNPARRLRLALLSAGFGRHPVGWLTLAGIEALPRTEFEIVTHSLRPQQDALARRFQARADQWREHGRLSDAQLAEAILADAPDILIDLGGHGEGGRVTVLSQRLAPVQVKWVGAQSATTGVPGVDWMLTDRWQTPPGCEPHYTEKLLRLADGYVCYTPPPWGPPVGPLPALRDENPRRHVTFGCFNNLAKITPDVLACWAAILHAVPRSRLVLRTHALGDVGTRDAFLARCSLDPSRLDLHGYTPHEELLDGYNAIDIGLDPFPYAGGLTACEALWMGVPMVAMAGNSFAGRHAVSHLNNVGLGDWVAEDAAGYVARAVAAARDLPALALLRAGLRGRMEASPLMDAPRFGISLAAALRHAWLTRCHDELRVHSGAGSAM